MRRGFPVEFVFQVFSLIIVVILVHAVYVTSVRPSADRFLAEQRVLMDADPEYVAERSVWVLVRDFEQETCFVLMIWAIGILGFKGIAAVRQRRLLESDIIHLEPGQRIRPEHARELATQLEALPRDVRYTLLPRAMAAALTRFDGTANVQDVSTATRELCGSEAARLESELSIIRYIAWAIPSIGFIGTVRGIGEALGQAHRAVEGDITGVTESLGVAFNSTLIALLISIVVMFFVHQLQLAQERLVLDTEAYCDEYLIRHLESD